jgi:hypothetical protein
MGASSAVSKEIYLLVGTQGTDKAKADLQEFDRSVKKSTDAAKDNAAGATRLAEAWKRFGDVKEKVGRVIERFGFALSAIPGFVGLIGGTISGVIDTFKAFGEAIDLNAKHEKAMKEATERTNVALAAQKKHLQEIADVQFGAFSATRNRVASVAGVDPSSMSPAQLATSERLAQRQEELTLNRNAKEREYVAILREQSAIVAQARSAGNILQQSVLLSQAERSGVRRRQVESELRQYREQQVSIEREIRSAGGAGLSDRGAAPSKKAEDDGKTKALVAAIAARVAAYVGALAEEKKAQDAAMSAADKAAADYRKKQEDDFRSAADLYRQQQEWVAQQRERLYGEGKDAGAKGGMFALIGENDVDKIRGIQDAIHEGITRPAQIARDATAELGAGLADAAAASILEGKSFKAASNEVLKSITRKALAMAIFEGAAALASLAILDFRGAALHGQAALMYGGVAAVAGIGAAATGGVGASKASGGGSSSAGASSNVGAARANTNSASGGSGGPTVYNFVVNYNGIRTSTRDHEDLIRMLNSQAGRNGAAKIDRRLVA